MQDLHLFSVPDHPKEGGLVALLPGSDPKAKAILLLAHLDVVEARREDWTRDPFTLIEEDGYFYGRGTADDKSSRRGVGGYDDALQTGACRPSPPAQAGAHLRRGNQWRLQWRAVSGQPCSAT